MAKKLQADKAKVTFVQSQKKQEQAEFVYDEYNFMTDEVMGKNYEEFNNRTLRQFVDDSEKRANSYTPTRESQGKEEWQANVFSGTTRNKIRAYAGSMSKEPPQIRMTAVNDENQQSIERAEVLSTMTRRTYMSQNPSLDMLLDGWDCSVDGTIVKYDGYMLVKEKPEIVKSYDATTGEVVMEKIDKEEVVEDKHFEETIPLKQFLIRDPFVSEVQKQPAIIWAQYVELEDFMFEYGKYPDAKMVETKSMVKARGEESVTFFGRDLTGRIDENKVEVLLYYRKRMMDD